MKFQIVTLFPDYFRLSLRESLLGKALDKKLFDIEIIQLRDFALDKHRTVDDTPYGGGGGMVLAVEPLDRCLEALGFKRKAPPGNGEAVVLTSAAGRTFSQTAAIRYSLLDRLTIICGHYLGVDERILDLYEIEEVSVGDYILTGGEPAAAVMVDAVARLVPGVLQNFASAMRDSFMDEILGAPCYTKPAEYRGLKVPQALVSGNHGEIERFRRQLALRKCACHRPDLLKPDQLSAEDRAYVDELRTKNNSLK